MKTIIAFLKNSFKKKVIEDHSEPKFKINYMADGKFEVWYSSYKFDNVLQWTFVKSFHTYEEAHDCILKWKERNAELKKSKIVIREEML